MDERSEKTIFEMLAKIYRSDSGRSLTSNDWHSIAKEIEDLNERLDNKILRVQPELRLPILLQPISALTGPLEADRSQLNTRARSVMAQFDYVFQLVKASFIPGAGPKIQEVINQTLKQHGLQIGQDISEFEEYLNKFRAERPAIEDGHFGAYLKDKGIFNFVPKHDVSIVARFSYQIWTIEGFGIKASDPSYHQAKEDFENAVAESWLLNPNQLKQYFTWVEHYELNGNDWSNRVWNVTPLWSEVPGAARPAVLFHSGSRDLDVIADNSDLVSPRSPSPRRRHNISSFAD
jgi:hypothetical protein